MAIHNYNLSKTCRWDDDDDDDGHGTCPRITVSGSRWRRKPPVFFRFLPPTSLLLLPSTISALHLITRHLVHSLKDRKKSLSISTSLECNQSNLHLLTNVPKAISEILWFVTFSLSPSLSPLGPIQSDLVAGGTFRAVRRPLEAGSCNATSATTTENEKLFE